MSLTFTSGIKLSVRHNSPGDRALKRFRLYYKGCSCDSGCYASYTESVVIEVLIEKDWPRSRRGWWSISHDPSLVSMDLVKMGST